MMVSHEFRQQLEGYGLTTAEITYRMPDHLSLLQTFVWQEYDRCPEFPVLHRFIRWWQRMLDGPVHSVRIAHHGLISPAEIQAVGAEFRLH